LMRVSIKCLMQYQLCKLYEKFTFGCTVKAQRAVRVCKKIN
jgi:hypothetical protein